MKEILLKELLEKVRAGQLSIEKALKQFQEETTDISEWACLDHHRHHRTGVPEVIYGENKTAEQIASILQEMLEHPSPVMATRIDPAKARLILQVVPRVAYHEQARMLIANPEKDNVGRGQILVVSAGTSDLPVAEEAYETAAVLGHRVERAYDVGVAGIHRLLAKKEYLQNAAVIIVVAGMEGALPSVVAGLVSAPVIAVPTSVGYGVGFGGLAALMGMLNSCAPGVAVVNIDNGFGAGCMAAAINRKEV